MAAYVIVDVTRIHDEETYALYRSRVPKEIADAGGRYLARGGAVQVLEGTWQPERVVVVSFETMQAARRWWESPRYAELKRMRQASTNVNMVVVNGLAEGEVQ